MQKFKILYLFLCLLATGNISAAEHQVKMLSSLNGQMMVFEPPVLNINKGDTVKWLNTNPGHNSVSINEMIPSNAKPWNGKMNESIKVQFDTEGVYGYKCTPHYILGMVGLIVVGNPSSNLDKAKAFAEDAQSKFATNKERFSEYFSNVK